MKSLEASESLFLPVGGLAPPLGGTIGFWSATRHATGFGRGVQPSLPEAEDNLLAPRPATPVAAWPGSCLATGVIRPVLKHGPRSLTCVRVFGWQTPTRR